LGRRAGQAFWAVIVPRHLDEKVRELVKAGYYTSKSDLIRDAVRKIIAELEKQQK